MDNQPTLGCSRFSNTLSRMPKIWESNLPTIDETSQQYWHQGHMRFRKSIWLDQCPWKGRSEVCSGHCYYLKNVGGSETASNNNRGKNQKLCPYFFRVDHNSSFCLPLTAFLHLHVSPDSSSFLFLLWSTCFLPSFLFFFWLRCSPCFRRFKIWFLLFSIFIHLDGDGMLERVGLEFLFSRCHCYPMCSCNVQPPLSDKLEARWQGTTSLLDRS